MKGWIASLSPWRSPRAHLPVFLLYLLAAVPAFLTGCQNEGEGQEVTVTELDIVCAARVGGYAATRAADSWKAVRKTDIFVFRQDGPESLDSYTRCDGAGTLKVPSGKGPRTAVVIANGCLEDEDILSVRSRRDLEAMESEFVQDSPEYPLMSGETCFEAGDSGGCTVVLEPLMSEVCLTSLTCRMTGEYEGKCLTGVKAYLTNISGKAPLMQQKGFNPSEILNYEYLSETDLRRLGRSSYVYAYLGDGHSAGGGRGYGSTTLYCYPNDAAEETPGTPFTKLVIEGKIDGVTHYYPITIAREGRAGQEGIARNARYSLNVTITGPGLSDPLSDIPESSRTEQGWMTVYPSNFMTARDGERIHIWVDVFPEDVEVSPDIEDLEFDKERGIYDYEIDPDGKGVWLTLLKGGSGAFIINAGPPVNDGLLVIVVVNP